MSITIMGDLDINTEQIKNKSRTDKVIDSVREILEYDEFNFFNTKSKRKLKLEIDSTEKTIKKLIELKLTAVGHGKKLKEQYKRVSNENQKLAEKLSSEIEI